MSLAPACAAPPRARLLAERPLPTGPPSAVAAAADAAEPARRAAADRRSAADRAGARPRAAHARAAEGRDGVGLNRPAARGKRNGSAAADAEADAPPGLVWVSDESPGIRRVRQG